MKIHQLKTPITDEDILKIKVGEYINITGEIIFARDEAHKKALKLYKKNKEIPFDYDGGVLYHVGPIALNEKGIWKIIAAGPTTSVRMEMFEPEFIQHFNIKIILGKGGMSGETINTFKEYKSIYGTITGGTALIWAKKIKNVIKVDWLELGIPEALWQVNVKDFGPILVTIDSYGNNLYEDVQKNVYNNKEKVFEFLDIDG